MNCHSRFKVVLIMVWLTSTAIKYSESAMHSTFTPLKHIHTWICLVAKEIPRVWSVSSRHGPLLRTPLLIYTHSFNPKPGAPDTTHCEPFEGRGRRGGRVTPREFPPPYSRVMSLLYTLTCRCGLSGYTAGLCSSIVGIVFVGKERSISTRFSGDTRGSPAITSEGAG